MKSDTVEDLFSLSSPFLTLKEASDCATTLLGEEVSESLIKDILEIKRVDAVQSGSQLLIQEAELKSYLTSRRFRRERLYKQKVGDDLLWHLSFDQYRESETTKHVHRLHPYKGKYIPQLVEYFLDTNTDKHKTSVSFNPGDVVLDPFAGSGTTLVQGNELNLHGIGIDVAAFNCVISNAKITRVNLEKFHDLTLQVKAAIANCTVSRQALAIDEEVSRYLSELNGKYFPKPAFPTKIRSKEIDGEEYSKPYLSEFIQFYQSKVENSSIAATPSTEAESFITKWFPQSIQAEIQAALKVLELIDDSVEKVLLQIALSRAVRSSRSTKHYDLATLVEPNFLPYYCAKHFKICKPLVSMHKWFKRYAKDSLKRVTEFDLLRTDTEQICLQGDSRTLDIQKELTLNNPKLAETGKKARHHWHHDEPAVCRHH